MTLMQSIYVDFCGVKLEVRSRGLTECKLQA